MKIILDWPLHLMSKKSLKALIRLWSRKYEDDLGLTTPSAVEKKTKRL